MYGKIYEQTFTGSMVGSGGCVFAVWAYVIAHTKPDSLVELNPTILSSILGEPIEKIQTAVDVLKSEDPSSRSKVHNGRRLIEKGPFLYFVPNYLKYRGLPNDETRRSYFAEKQRERRARLRDCQTVSSNESNSVKQAEAISSNHKAEAKDIRVAPPEPERLNFVDQLKALKVYQGIDIDREIGKMQAWLTTPKGKGRKLTKGFVVNWLNKIDVEIAAPITPNRETPTNTRSHFYAPPPEGDKSHPEIVAEAMAQLKQKVNR